MKLTKFLMVVAALATMASPMLADESSALAKLPKRVVEMKIIRSDGQQKGEEAVSKQQAKQKASVSWEYTTTVQGQTSAFAGNELARVIQYVNTGAGTSIRRAWLDEEPGKPSVIGVLLTQQAFGGTNIMATPDIPGLLSAKVVRNCPTNSLIEMKFAPGTMKGLTKEQDAEAGKAALFLATMAHNIDPSAKGEYTKLLPDAENPDIVRVEIKFHESVFGISPFSPAEKPLVSAF